MIAFLVGLAIGAASSVAPGPCALAVLEAARASRRRGLGTALGCALGDLTCASLGVAGLGVVLAQHPSLAPALRGSASVGLCGYGALSLRRHGLAVPSSRGGFARGVMGGLAALAIGNPAAVLGWVVLVGAFGARWPLAIGVGGGSFAWYAMLALAAPRLGHRLRGATIVLATLLIAVGVCQLVLVTAG